MLSDLNLFLLYFVAATKFWLFVAGDDDESTNCGPKFPEISGGYWCSYESDSSSGTTVTYCCDDQKEIGTITCKPRDTNWPTPPSCGAPSPCPLDIPASAPYSPEYALTKCNAYQNSSGVLCLKNAKNAKILKTSISQVLKAHNCWRKNVFPSAAKMPDLVWDDDLAAMAERWAAQCKPFTGDANNDHTPDKWMYIPNRGSKGPAFNYVGQNIDWGTDTTKTWPKGIDDWATERNYWKYGVGKLFPNEADKEVGHYTQMIWAETTNVGCAMVQCKGNENPIVMVCNYGPGGNVGSDDTQIFGYPYVSA